MRVLITADTVGGVWTFARQLSWELLTRDCAIALVSVGRLPSEAQMKTMRAYSARWGTQFLFATSGAPLEWEEENDGAYSDAAPLLREVASDFDADIILTSQFCFGALPFDGPKLVVAHSDVLSWGKACRGEKLPPSPWLNRYCTMVGEGLTKADAVVAPTHWMLHALQEEFRIPGEHHVVYNGRSILLPDRRAPRQIQAIAAGRLWDEAKNLQLLGKAELPIPLLIAGDAGPMTSQFRCPTGNTTLLGPVDEEEILSLFFESMVYVCASKYEPFGLAPLEAALCGCAVVANDIPSLREIWGDAALYFNDATSLSALLDELSRNECTLKAAREQAHSRASNFTASNMAEGYLKLFRSALARKVGAYAV